jgi:hypothetical protein
MMQDQRSHLKNRERRSNIRLARTVWGELSRPKLLELKELTRRYGLSVALGDLRYLDQRWYVTHSGLLRLACRKKCLGIRTTLQKTLSDAISNRWVFKAVAFTSPGSKGFVGYGDADPSNVSPLVRGAEMRVAETRAVNRALRKAYGIGLCSVEELGYLSSPPELAAREGSGSTHSNRNGSGKGQPRLRDRLCLLIRQHQLDPTLVKRYAADFCGTQELREASRDLVQSFITHLADWAARDRSGLLCKLNSFAPSQEVHS